MSKSFELQGVIHSIGETTAYGNNGFTKREFVIKLSGAEENSQYPSYAALELIKDKCSLMDSYNPGDEIIAHFNISGRLWSSAGKPEKCFTSLQAWRVEPAGHGATNKSQVPDQSFDENYSDRHSSDAQYSSRDDDFDDIPF
jgi:hypothetical protein